MKLTVPQLVMLNHASAVNRERGEKRWEHKRKKEEEASKKQEENEQTASSEPLSEMNSTQWAAYYGGFFTKE